MTKQLEFLDHNAYLYRLLGLGPEVTSISVKNLQATIAVGQNPWGYTHSQEPFLQPVLLSAKVSLVEPFDSAAKTDQLNHSTINYSTLSKEILKCVKGREFPGAPGSLLEHIFEHLLRWSDTQGKIMDPSRDETNTAPLLRLEDIRELELKIKLSKGTLLSESINLTLSTLFPHGKLDPWQQTEFDEIKKLFIEGDIGEEPTLQPPLPHGYRSFRLNMDGLRVPTIIGINKNERTAKQNIITSVGVEPAGAMGPDGYNVLEQVVYKTIEESSFETLETLVEHVVTQVADLCFPFSLLEELLRDEAQSPTIRVRLEKPTAVTFADAPCVEIVRIVRLMEGKECPRYPPIPFPIKGTLQEWIKANPKRIMT